MPGGQPLRLGPFLGGLNTASDPTAIADAELVKCLNFELDIDGSLISRPPLKELVGHTDWTERIICLCEGIFSSDHYIIGSNTNGVYYYINSSWTLITNTFQASAAVQYADKIYLIAKPGSANPGGKWDPVGGFTAVSAIPKGQAAVIHKERLFIAPGIKSTSDTSRLKFSDPGNFDSWPAGNFIDIGQGDGTKLVDLTVFQDNVLLFKQQSTYVLSYDVRPADAVVRKISLTIGVNGQFNVLNYENQVYIFHGGWVYEIINYDFQRLNTKVPFIRDDTAPSAFSDETIFLSLIEDRLICRYYKKVYVYGLRTRTWSEWESTSNILQYFGPIITIHPSTGNEYYSGSCVSSSVTIIKFIDTYTASSKEQDFSTISALTDTASVDSSSSWSNADTGQSWTTSGGSASDYSKSGGKAVHSQGSVNVFRACTSSASNVQDFDITLTISSNALATGSSHIFGILARYIDANNFYTAEVAFSTTQSVVLAISKVVAGTGTSLVSSTVGGLTHAANTEFTVRFKGQGSKLTAKIWLTSNNQPAAWSVAATDSSITAAGGLIVRSRLDTGNTNTLPVLCKWDNIQLIDTALVTKIITCSAKTKNFDMAISHQYKRLWYWGADVSSNNNIVGIATPVIVSFNVTWSSLSASAWNSLNTWSQPLSSPASVTTTATTGTGTARRFAKFLKSLRYRQINFEVRLTTEGSTVDGPARLFTMTIITESKQVVSKAVS
jgi:hypothetical protein